MESERQAAGQVTYGIVLCGGRSRRMGRPKAWLPFGDELLLPRIVRIVGEAVESVVVVAAPGQKLPPLPDRVRIVRDRDEGLGPLNGLATGLAAISDRVDSIFLTSCDAPLLKPAFVRRIVELLGPHAIAIPRIDGFPQPLHAAYRIEGLLNRIDRLLASEKRGLVDLLKDADVRFIGAEELPDLDESLRNINTPEEYEAVVHGMK